MSDLRDSQASINGNEKYFQILIATDIHLGYGEKNEILGMYLKCKQSENLFSLYFVISQADDSFNTFEEILQIANSRDVDFILLGGDLFHDATPSPNSLNK